MNAIPWHLARWSVERWPKGDRRERGVNPYCWRTELHIDDPRWEKPLWNAVKIQHKSAKVPDNLGMAMELLKTWAEEEVCFRLNYPCCVKKPCSHHKDVRERAMGWKD